MSSLARQGQSLVVIAHRLTFDNVPAKRGGRWFASAVRCLLSNTLYDPAGEGAPHERNRTPTFARGSR